MKNKKILDPNNLEIPQFIIDKSKGDIYELFISKLVYERGHEKIKGYHKHHIIMRSKGGSNIKKNIIYLSRKEHIHAHRLMLIENPTDLEIQRAYIAIISFNKKYISKKENDFVLELKKVLMKTFNPMLSDENRKKIRLTKLGENNPACRIDQRIVLYKDSAKTEIEEMFYTLKSSGKYIFDKGLGKSIASAMVTINQACQNKIKYAYGKYWSYTTDKNYYDYIERKNQNENM